MSQKPNDSNKSNYKIIHDTIHRTIKLDEPALSLLETAELQRLNNIHQLGLAYLVFPGANHTRLEHSLGTFHVANSIAHALNLDDEERLLVTTAAMLHDIGHGPYSHTLEYLFELRLGISHTRLTQQLILGEENIFDEVSERILQPKRKIHEILEEYSVDAETVAGLICNELREFDNTLSITGALPIHNQQQFFNSKRYLFQIIHSSIDADQIDYLLRDSFYTGVAHGVLDIDRLIQTIEIFNNDLVVNKHGLSAVEGMLVARALMYSSVYFHKTVRIAELMLSRALEHLEDDQLKRFIFMPEGELVVELMRLGGFQRELITLLMYRRLFKRVFYIKTTELDDSDKEIIQKFDEPKVRIQAEDEIADRASVPEGHVIIDVPAKELKFSEPRVNKTDIKILDGTVKPLTRYSPLAQALKIKNIPEWALMVVTDNKYKEQVVKAAKKVIFG
jgi:HD superfamily phosphohydrolase